MNDFVQIALKIAKRIQDEVPRFERPPSETAVSPSEMVFPHSLVKGTRDYIEKIAYQINGAYGNGWYDACAVMLRRLIETLIIEAFEYHKIADKIKNENGDYLYLNNLITKTLSEPSWTLGRIARTKLRSLKDLGDQSAHSRRFIAHREDVDRISNDIRTVVQELVYLATLK